MPPRTQRIAAGAGAAGLVLVIVAGLLVGLSVRGSNGGSGRPGIAGASASVGSSSSGLTFGTTALPTVSSTPKTPDDGVSDRVPDTLATIDCSADPTAPVVSGGRLYVSCSGGATVLAIDLATDTVAQTYAIPDEADGPIDMMIVDSGLWLSRSTDSTSDVQRIDLTTGQSTKLFEDSDLIADMPGSLWMDDANDKVVKVDPATGKTSAVRGNLASVLGWDTFVGVGCGMIWGQRMEGNPPNFNPVGGPLRVNPATGALTDMGTADVDGALLEVLQAGSTCWGIVDDPDSGLVRLGAKCADMLTDGIPADPWVLGDTFWMMSEDGTYIDQIEPFGGVEGRHWLVPTDEDSWMISTSGQVWVAETGGRVVRLDIPLDKMKPGATPETLSCAAPVASASPSPSASASPTPTATATPSPAPTPTPTPTPTPEPTPSPSASDSTTP
jgi:cell division septation protein DedD